MTEHRRAELESKTKHVAKTIHSKSWHGINPLSLNFENV